MIPADVWTVRSWGLGHHSGIVTYPHHDAEGALTFAVGLSGVKNWVVITPQNPIRDEMGDFLADLSGPQASLLDYLDQVDAETIHLNPGDLL